MTPLSQILRKCTNLYIQKLSLYTLMFNVHQRIMQVCSMFSKEDIDVIIMFTDHVPLSSRSQPRPVAPARNSSLLFGSRVSYKRDRGDTAMECTSESLVVVTV